MARIIENEGKRRIIKLSSKDIMAVVREYQNIVPRHAHYKEIENYLSDRNIYIPEDC